MTLFFIDLTIALFLWVAIITTIVTIILKKYGITKIIKNSPHIVGIFSFAVLMNITISNPIGYCSKKQQFFNDEDFIVSVLWSSNRSISLRSFAEDLKINSRETAQAFYMNNPNCCIIYRESKGENNILIHITYRISDDLFEERTKGRTHGIISPYYIEKLIVSSCGQHIKHVAKNVDQSEYLSYLQQTQIGE